jgi:nicotinate-nucleotide adenylyltransferase
MKIGLFFGSFNPIHIGHMALANYVVEYAEIDQLWFIVSPHNPLKLKANLLDDYQRLEMVHRAVGNDPRFRVNDIEFRLPKPSYTIDTLTYLSEKHPKHQFFPIVGGDNLENIKKWKNYEILLRDYSFIVYPRPGYNLDKIDIQGNFAIVNAPQIEISSTFIRQAISEKHDVRYFLPANVYEYIEEMAFYQ